MSVLNVIVVCPLKSIVNKTILVDLLFIIIKRKSDNYYVTNYNRLHLKMTSSLLFQLLSWSYVYSVDQTVTEGETSIGYTSAYTVVVHVDGDGNLVITQNPTISSIPTKSVYEPKVKESDGTVDAATMEEVTEFLETFFKLYPTATEKELAYYVSGNVLEPVKCDYVFSELVNPIFTQDGEQVKVSVKYLDQRTKATQISQFDLILEKDSN